MLLLNRFLTGFMQLACACRARGPVYSMHLVALRPQSGEARGT